MIKQLISTIQLQKIIMTKNVQILLNKIKQISKMNLCKFKYLVKLLQQVSLQKDHKLLMEEVGSQLILNQKGLEREKKRNLVQVTQVVLVISRMIKINMNCMIQVQIKLFKKKNNFKMILTLGKRIKMKLVTRVLLKKLRKQNQ